jgi:polyisoprenoid-binding protein YceI
MHRVIAAAAGLLLLSTPALAQDTWNIDSGHSAAQFAVKHLMVSTVRGTLGTVKGTVRYDGKNLSSIAADVIIDVTAVNSRHEKRDADLRSANFFDVEKFPTATFKSTRVEPVGPGKFRLIGDLTMHGVTKEVALDVEGPVAAGNRLGATATTTLNRRDFGLEWNRMVETVPVVGDEVAVTIDLELARPRPASP